MGFLPAKNRLDLVMMTIRVDLPLLQQRLQPVCAFLLFQPPPVSAQARELGPTRTPNEIITSRCPMIDDDDVPRLPSLLRSILSE
jgi:hypothetical protein